LARTHECQAPGFEGKGPDASGPVLNACPLPLQVTSGEVNGQVEVDMQGKAEPSLTGTVRLAQGSLKSTALPQPLQQIEGTLRLQGQTFNLENLTARLGAVTASGGGTIDLARGYNLRGQIKSFSPAQVRDLWAPNLKLPMQGRLAAEAVITGPLTQPTAIASLTSTSPVKIDQVTFQRIAARATLEGSRLQLNGLEALPTGGGAITAQGQLPLDGQGSVALTLKGDRLPADTLAQPYGLPKTIKLGPVSVEAQVTGPLAQNPGPGGLASSPGYLPSPGTGTTGGSKFAVYRYLCASCPGYGGSYRYYEAKSLAGLPPGH
jgi:translocation and assembly module TamB